MTVCDNPEVNCDVCFEVLIGDCLATITLSLGLTPSALFFFRLLDKSGRKYDFTATTDVLGDFTIDKTQLPDDLINQFAGDFELQIFSDSGRTTLVIVVQNSTGYNCILLVQQLSGSNNITPPDPIFFNTKSILLDGFDERVVVPHSSVFDFGTGDFAVSIWINPTSLVVNKTIIGTKNPWAATTTGWELAVQDASNIKFRLREGATVLDNNFNPVSLGVWTNIIINVYVIGGTQFISFYINNVLGITSSTGSPLNINNADDLRFGHYSGFFDGGLDEPSIWKKRLSPQDRADIFDNGPSNLLTHASVVDLVGWWRLGDEGVFAANWTFPDQTTNGNDGVSENMEFEDVVTDAP